MYEWILVMQLGYSSQQITMKTEVACKAAQTQLALNKVATVCLNKNNGIVDVLDGIPQQK
jgi:hypothetical protein